ncbi:uncharacterized protein LOC105437677 [Strongylocentrotus purpuratus]|uniref:EGF-like domain-containing protein n=1 Tax=Strongylocentrotus purpuratus TaxID=7668 RepID=A0A7M7P064_STRPU|nr:uncharacterized protein LOC105437677 [Strongylocentrotus purpuratus]
MLISEIKNNTYFLFADNNANLKLSPRVEDVSVNAIDECLLGENDCSENADCIDLDDAGGFNCTCNDGYDDLMPQLPGRLCSLIVTNDTVNTTELITTPYSTTVLDPGSSALETWQIILITVGSISAGLLVALCCCWLLLIPLRRRRYREKADESVIYNHWHHATDEPAAFFARVYDGSSNDSTDTPSMRTRSSRPFSPSVVSNPLARDYSLPHLDPLGDDVSESIRHYAVDPMETSIRQSFKRVLNDVIARGPPGQNRLRARVPDHLAAFLEEGRSSEINSGVINEMVHDDPYNDVDSPSSSSLARRPITPNVFFARVIDGSE